MKPSKLLVVVFFVLTNVITYMAALELSQNKSDDQIEGQIVHDSKSKPEQSLHEPELSLSKIKQLIFSKKHQEKDNFSGFSRIYSSIQKMNENELKSLMESFDESLYFDDTYADLKILILQEWEKLNPSGLLDFIANKIEFSNFKAQVFTRWSKKEPVEVLNYLRNNYPLENFSQYLVGGFAANSYDQLFHDGKEKAFEQLSQEDPNLLTAVLYNVVLNLSDPEDFQKVIESTKGKIPEIYLIHKVVSQWTKISPEDAMSWVENISDEQLQKTGMSQVTSAWMTEEPVKAANWVLENNGSSPKEFEHVASYWPYKDKNGLVAWLDTLPDSNIKNRALGDVIMLSVVQEVYDKEDYNLALKRITEEKLKADVVTDSYTYVFNRDGEKKASEFLASIDVDPSIKTALLNSTPAKFSAWSHFSYLRKNRRVDN